MNSIGAYHLADNPDLYEVMRDNTFEFIITDIDNLVRVDDNTSVIPNAQEVLRFSVVSAPIPFFTQETVTINRGNSVMKAAGKPTFSDGSLVVNDYIGADTKSALMAWQNLSYNVKTEAVGKMSDYKKTCYLVEYTPNLELVRTWKLFGCWVSGLSEGDFNMEQSGKKQITATITYDKAMMELPD